MKRKWVGYLLIGLIGLAAILLMQPKPTFEPIIKSDTLPQVQETGQFSFMTVNVGNSNLRCQKYFWKLCIAEVEKNIAENLQRLQPDIVVLQEVLTYEKCAEHPTDNPEIICSQYNPNSHQAARLLGNDYSIVCDTNAHMQCIGVHQRLGVVEGCAPGEVCNNGRTIDPVGECNPYFTIFAVTVTPDFGEVFDIVNVHLNSRDSQCRSAAFEQLFVQSPEGALIKNDRVIIAGDFNSNLYKDQDEATETILARMESSWHDRPFTRHETLDAQNNPLITFKLGWINSTLDYMFSNFLTGEVVVLGESPGTTRLDGGWGMDHFAVFGVFKSQE